MNELYTELKEAFEKVQAEKNSPLELNKEQSYLWELHTRGFNILPDEAHIIYKAFSNKG